MGFFAKSVQNAPLPGKWVKSSPWNPYALSAFCLGVLLGNSVFAQTNSVDAEQLFNAMLVNVQSLRTIEAEVRVEVFVMGKEHVAKGKYEEQRLENPPPGDFQRSMYRLYLYFASETPTTPGSERNSLTVICHPTSDRDVGRLWKYRSIEGVKSVQYVNLAKLEDAVRQRGRQSLIGNVGETKNLGGLSGTLKQIARFYGFADSPGETVMDGGESRPVWKIVGTLRSEFEESMTKAFGGLEKKTNNFPNQMPTDIEIFIGVDDAFPYKIEYRNRPKADSSKRTVLTRIVYSDVSLNGEPIPELKFSAFDKGNLPEGVYQTDDITEQVIRSIR